MRFSCTLWLADGVQYRVKSTRDTVSDNAREEGQVLSRSNSSSGGRRRLSDHMSKPLQALSVSLLISKVFTGTNQLQVPSLPSPALQASESSWEPWLPY